MMTALSFSINPIELELLVGIAVVLLVVASFLVVSFSAIIGACVPRLLYLAGSYCVNEIRYWRPVSGTGTENESFRIAARKIPT
jgi:hypothetical protein